ncbi:hypothetical protein ACMDCR_01360 [Labrys okinawensis]|uniref:hypothetical protein n=1 Tax=Labrys okinawensis TaxID=346911 RepID=UPI0039BD4ED6
MKKLVISAIAAAGLALSASAAFAHGHVVTGPDVYAVPEAAAPAPQVAPAVHKTRIIRHAAHAPRVNTAS